ncbi:MAG TPA: hypothetical protein VFI25_14875 [Planctomycetota bacterium]|jgi:hypothetical protein|nr:hypothetical protein [Planctomycetota bacterium]
MKKILIAGLLGGLVNFVWGAVWHMALPVGKAGLSRIPDEGPVLGAVQAHVREPGLYSFPWMEVPAGASAERKEAIEKEWAEKYRHGPSGLLILRRSGEEPMRPAQLLTEFGSNVLCAIVAAALLCRAAKGGTGFLGRAGFCALLGFFASVSIDASYWNWYGFPTSFTLASLVDQTVGWGLAGLAIGAVVRNPPAP